MEGIQVIWVSFGDQMRSHGDVGLIPTGMVFLYLQYDTS